MKYLHKFVLILTITGILVSGIPTADLGANETTHLVSRGETIFSISRAYGVTVDELMRANNITDPSTLQAGRRIIIPARSTTVVSSPNSGTSNLRDYHVIRGDTFYSIARVNGITVPRLLEINGFSSNHVLRAGDVIKIPSTSVASPQGSATQGSSTQGSSTQGSGTQSSSTQGSGTAQGSTSANSNTPIVVPPPSTGIYSLRWPVTPKDITYMTGQMGVVVQGERLESVKSLTQGNVVNAGPWRKYGRVVIIETAGGYYYMYGGLDSLSVNVGTRITPGMEIGKLGINTVSELPQLFFMVFRNDTPIDPALAPRSVAQIDPTDELRVGILNNGNDPRS